MSKTLITMTQGNPIALKRTVESLSQICDEFIIGDLCIFTEDRLKIFELELQYNVKIVPLPFNYIYKNGFSDTLNRLAGWAKNDVVLYMNVGEVIDKIHPEFEQISDKHNAWYINHSQELHRWFRMYNRKQMKWDGLIHEEIIGEWRPYHKPVLMFADTPKDENDLFKAKVYDSVKELVYFNQLCKIVDDNSLLGATSSGWLEFAASQYAHNKERMNRAGKRLEAMETGNFEMFYNDIMTGEDFKNERFETNHIIEFQGPGNNKYLGKNS